MTQGTSRPQDRPGVALLWHFRITAGDEWGKDGTERLVGIYSSHANAEAAIARLRDKPGFCDWPDGFRILEYRLNEDVFPDGFAHDDA